MRFFYISVAVMALAAESQCAISNEIVLPNHEFLGRCLNDTKALLIVPKHQKSVFPESIQLDLKNGHVFGIMAKYANATTFQDLEESVNFFHKKWLRSSDPGPINLSLWRNERKRYSIQIYDSESDDEGPTLIMIKIGEDSQTGEDQRGHSGSAGTEQ